MEQFRTKDTLLAYEERGDPMGPVVLWGHGWGQDHHAFDALAGSLAHEGRHILLDFPGFGDSPPPAKIWGTDDYADAVAEWIRDNTNQPVIWVGHSFGARVGIQLAARHPGLVAGLFLIAGAGLKRKRPLHKAIYFQGQVWTFKLLRNFVPLGMVDEDWLKKRFGSKDYRDAGAMRGIFIRIVNEDLSEQARQIHCPVKLVYGTKDEEAPPQIGERLNRIIANSEMVHLEGEDHYSILAGGRHQVAALLSKFIKETGDRP